MEVKTLHTKMDEEAQAQHSSTGQHEMQPEPENTSNNASLAPPGALPAPAPTPAPAPSRPASRTPVPPPIQREQREKKDSLKKRESAAPPTTHTPTSNSSSLGKRKAHQVHAYPSPQRFNIPPPKAQDFEAPKDDMMAEHEPNQFWVPGEERQLYKPIDLAENKRGYRYQRAIADPVFTHKQYYRSTSPAPHGARLSFEDADRWMHFTTNALTTSNEKGWRMVRANVCAREGTLYYEVRVRRGVPLGGPDPTADGPQSFVRFGWARREAPLDAPVGFDGYSYGITDMRFETMHRSRPGKFFQPKKGKNKSKVLGGAPTPITLAPEDQHVKEGDVIGMEIQLPSLSLQQKIVTGVYNPAVDIGDGFTASNAPPVPGPDEQVPDVIRDRIPVAYKGNSYFEILDHVSTRPMEVYSDRTTNLTTLATQPGASAGVGKDTIKQVPNPNHEQAPLRTLPHSAIRVYKNGKPIGTAFENLLAFLPPASQPSKQQGAREGGFDDAMTGYFPAVSCFFGGTAEINFGDGKDGFWEPPAHLRSTKVPISVKQHRDSTQDIEMHDAPTHGEQRGRQGWRPGKECRPIGERYKEQVAEDIVYDIIDEVDFFVQDGGYEGKAGPGALETEGDTRARSRLRED
jgi:COMPASS component BRE2